MIGFVRTSELLKLSYKSANVGTKWIFEKFKKNEEVVLRKTFSFLVSDLDYLPTDQDNEPNYDEAVLFKLGISEKEYFRIDRRILQIKNDIFLHQSIELTSAFFIAEENVSVFKKMAALLNDDLYIGGEKENSLPLLEYNKLLKNFPSKIEIKKYVEARISLVIKNHIDNTKDGESLFTKYMNKRPSQKGKDILQEFTESEIYKFEEVLKKLQLMLASEVAYNEKQWQKEILQIILLLYPKYLYVFEGTVIKDSYYEKERKLDLLLIDSSGNIDVIEIKKPVDNNMVSPGTYRDNHIPLRELSGAIMQLEKYIFNLSRWGRDGEETLTKKYESKLPDNFRIKITNPGGLIIMGRDYNLSSEQKQDFEIIKRKYKNIVDIITYDDLLRRLNFTISQLQKRQ